jgi:hypothetical protein
VGWGTYVYALPSLIDHSTSVGTKLLYSISLLCRYPNRSCALSDHLDSKWAQFDTDANVVDTLTSMADPPDQPPITTVEALVIILLADAETVDGQLFAAAVALHVLHAKRRGGKYGPRGPKTQQCRVRCIQRVPNGFHPLCELNQS